MTAPDAGRNPLSFNQVLWFLSLVILLSSPGRLCLADEGLSEKEAAELLAEVKKGKKQRNGMEEPAEKDREEGGDVFDLDEFVVNTNEVDGYLASNSLTASRLGLAVKDIPVNAQIITSEFMEDAGFDLFADIANYSSSLSGDSANAESFNSTISHGSVELTGMGGAGTGPGGSRGRSGINVPNAVLLRGSSVTITRNGLPRNAGDSLRNVDRVEIVKGPLTAIFGQSALGGMINYTTKRPVDHRFAEILLKYGSYDFRSGEITYNDTLGRWFQYRLFLSKKRSDDWQDYSESDEDYASLVLKLKPLKSLEVIVEGEYVDQFSRPGGKVILTNPVYHQDYFNPPDELLKLPGTTWTWNENRVDENGKPLRVIPYDTSVKLFRIYIRQNREIWMQARYAAYGEYPFKLSEYGFQGSTQFVDPELIEMDFDDPAVNLLQLNGNQNGPEGFAWTKSKTAFTEITFRPSSWFLLKFSGNYYEKHREYAGLGANIPWADLTLNGVAASFTLAETSGWSAKGDLLLTHNGWGMTNRLFLGWHMYRTWEDNGKRVKFSWEGNWIPYEFWNWTKITPPPLSDIFEFGIYDEDTGYRETVFDRMIYSVNYQGSYFDEHLHVLMGFQNQDTLRSYWNSKQPALGWQENTEQTTTSWMVGAVYEFRKGLAVYSSYSKKQFPVNQYSIVAGDPADLTAEDLEEREYLPARSETGIDLGMKLDLFDRRLSGQMSFFMAENRGIPRVDWERSMQNPLNQWNATGGWRVRYLTNQGLERTKGFEMELFAYPTRSRNWQMIFNYTHHFEAALVSDPSLAPYQADVILGRLLPNVAEDTVTFWNRYKITSGTFDGLSLAFGARYASDRNPLAREWSYNIVNEAYLVFDANISYRFTFWKADCNAAVILTNLTDEVYSSGGIGFASPRKIMVNLKMTF